MNDQMLNDLQLAVRWGFAANLEEADMNKQAIKKRFQRLRALSKSSPRHLPTFRPSKEPKYRLADVVAYEERNTK